MTEIAVVAESKGAVEYEIDIEADAVEHAGEGTMGAEDNDGITDNGDGTFTVEGYTGNPGYGDTFEFDGAVLDFREVSADADYRVEIDGTAVKHSDFGYDDGGDGGSAADPDFTVEIDTVEATDDGYVARGDMTGPDGSTEPFSVGVVGVPETDAIEARIDELDAVLADEVSALNDRIDTIEATVEENNTLIDRLRGLFS